MKCSQLLVLMVFLACGPVHAHLVAFKSPGPGMHFSEGHPIIIFADMSDSMITCPVGQTIVRPPAGTSGPAQCSGGAAPSGWPQMQVLIDGTLWTDNVTQSDTVPGTTNLDSNNNPWPANFHRFSAVGVSVGTHQLVVRGRFAPPPFSDGAVVDSAPITVTTDSVPSTLSPLILSSDVSGAVNWNNRYVVGNGHHVEASASLVITNSIVTGLGTMTSTGISGTVADAQIENTIFEDTGSVDIVIGNTAAIRNNEFRANNLLTFISYDPGASPIIRFRGTSAATKFFQGNRVGAGIVVFDGTGHWLVGGDTDAQGNIVIGPRGVLAFASSMSNVVMRGNYVHHNYRGGWSQGFNLTFCCIPNGSDVLIEHNIIRGGSWPVQSVSGEFRYNLVYGYGHDWVRSAASGASIHHNLFAPESGGGDLNEGVWFYGGENNIQIYNNTFDGGGAAAGGFAGPTVSVTGASRVASLRNNLITFSRDQTNGSAGKPRVIGDLSTIASADYNAFYSPDNTNHDNYSVAGMTEGSTPGFAVHDVSGSGAIGVVDGQLAATPFAGQRIAPYESVVDEAAVWNRTQTLSSILAEFRARYTPAPGSPVVNAGDLQDNDAHGRRTDIGAIDLNGHDLDKFGKFGPFADRIFQDGFQ